MILTTTPSIEGHPVQQYLGLITGEAIIGANAFKDIKANLRDFFGGHAHSYERVLGETRQSAMEELKKRAEDLGANAIVGIRLDYETVGASGSMLMVTCTGTAVRV